MTLSEQVDHDLKDAMKAREADRLSVLRMLKAAIKNAAIEKGGQAGRARRPGGDGHHPQADQAAAGFHRGVRAGHPARTRREGAGGDRDAPEIPAAGARTRGTRAAVDEAIAEVGATGKAQMGP